MALTKIEREARQAEAERAAERLADARRRSRDREDAGMVWFALFTTPQYERRVEVGLIEAGLCAYVPEGRKWSRPRRSPCHVERTLPAFPRYVFVGAVKGMPWHMVRSVGGVRAVVGQAGAPVRIGGDLIADCRAAQDMGMLDFNAEPNGKRLIQVFKPNDLVTIVSGPLEGHSAIVRRPSTNASVRVEMAGWLNGMAQIALDRLRPAA